MTRSSVVIGVEWFDNSYESWVSKCRINSKRHMCLHVPTFSRLHISTFPHPHLSTSSHLYIFTSPCLHISISQRLYIFHILTPYLHIPTPHLYVFTSSCLFRSPLFIYIGFQVMKKEVTLFFLQSLRLHFLHHFFILVWTLEGIHQGTSCPSSLDVILTGHLEKNLSLQNQHMKFLIAKSLSPILNRNTIYTNLYKCIQLSSLLAITYYEGHAFGSSFAKNICFWMFCPKRACFYDFLIY